MGVLLVCSVMVPVRLAPVAVPGWTGSWLLAVVVLLAVVTMAVAAGTLGELG